MRIFPTSYWVPPLLFSAIIVLISTNAALSIRPDHAQNISSESASILIYPEEYLIYLDYIKAIRGNPGKCDIGVIEGTVLSITKEYICPGGFIYNSSETANCQTELYPKVTGVVKIDKLTDYRPLLTGRAASHDELSSLEESKVDYRGDADTGSSENAAYQPLLKRKKYPGLNEVSEVDTIFLLTTEPVVIIYAAVNESAGNLEISITPKQDDKATDSQKIRSLKRKFKPIPISDNQFVFTTKVGSFPRDIRKKLPGLVIGSKFKATARFNGQLYIDEYERRE
jgi:hypothetical protein